MKRKPPAIRRAKSAVKTSVKKVDVAIESGDQNAAKKLFSS